MIVSEILMKRMDETDTAYYLYRDSTVSFLLYMAFQ